MAFVLLVFLALLFSCLAETSHGAILLSSLPNTLDMFVSDQVIKPNESWHFAGTIKAGEGFLAVAWWLNNISFPVGTDAAYKTVKMMLCYAPVSQLGRPERKTVDDLAKDKTCQIDMFTRPYNASSKWQYNEWNVDSHVPTASYFARAYVQDAAGEVVAYGQNTGPKKDYNLFSVQASMFQWNAGHKTSLDIVTSLCFSAFSIWFSVRISL